MLDALAAPLPVVAHREYAIVEVDGEDLWVFAPNLGRTLEDRLREDDFVGDDEPGWEAEDEPVWSA